MNMLHDRFHKSRRTAQIAENTDASKEPQPRSHLPPGATPAGPESAGPHCPPQALRPDFTACRVISPHTLNTESSQSSLDLTQEKPVNTGTFLHALPSSTSHPVETVILVLIISMHRPLASFVSFILKYFMF